LDDDDTEAVMDKIKSGILSGVPATIAHTGDLVARFMIL
jgi:hypothetical protein